jgi:hypothetical protein
LMNTSNVNLSTLQLFRYRKEASSHWFNLKIRILALSLMVEKGGEVVSVFA